MKIRVQFDFDFDAEKISYEEVKDLILLIENWSENQKGAFLDMPGGFRSIEILRKFIENYSK
jgi:hypothetical protein